MSEVVINMEPAAGAEGEHKYRITRLVGAVRIDSNDQTYRIGSVMDEKVVQTLIRRPFHTVTINERKESR